MNDFATKSSKFSNTLTKRSRVVAESPAPADGIHSLQFLQHIFHSNVIYGIIRDADS